MRNLGLQSAIFGRAIKAGKEALGEYLVGSMAVNPNKVLGGAWEAGVTGAVNKFAKLQERIITHSPDMMNAIGWDGKSEMTGKQLLKSLYTNRDGTWNKSALAKTGAAIGAVGYGVPATVGRIASGGGLYRDSDGKFDIIGVPII